MKREERERTEATEAKPAVNRTFKMATALSLVLFVTLALVTFAVVTASMMVDGSRSAGDGADEGALHNPLIGTAIASVVLGGALGTWQSRRIIAPVIQTVDDMSVLMAPPEEEPLKVYSAPKPLIQVDTADPDSDIGHNRIR